MIGFCSEEDPRDVLIASLQHELALKNDQLRRVFRLFNRDIPPASGAEKLTIDAVARVLWAGYTHNSQPFEEAHPDVRKSYRSDARFALDRLLIEMSGC